MTFWKRQNNWKRKRKTKNQELLGAGGWEEGTDHRET